MAKWLITGGAGFIGSHLAETLVNQRQSVRILDNFSTGSRANISHLLSRIELIRGDIRDPKAVRRALKGIDFVSHQAALRSVFRSVEDPLSTNSVNIEGTLVMLWESLRAKVKRFVYASSSSVYGDTKKFPQTTDQAPAPISPYAVSKLTGENYCRAFSKTYGLFTVSLRYFNVFGPGQDPHSKYAAVIPIFMKAAYENKPLVVQGTGRQSRDFAYIDNIVSANILATQSPNISGQAFNIACGESNSLLDYVALLKKLSGKKLKLKFDPPRTGDVPKTWADISKTKSLLGYRPLVRFADGIKTTWESYCRGRNSRGR